MNDLAENANKAPNTLRATTHTQEWPLLHMHGYTCSNGQLCKGWPPSCVCEDDCTGWGLSVFPAKLAVWSAVETCWPDEFHTHFHLCWSIFKRELCLGDLIHNMFMAALCLGIYELISFKLSTMMEKSRLYILMPV